MNDERQPVYQRMQELHIASIGIKNAYNGSSKIVFTWSEAPSWIPKFIRPLFMRPKELEAVCKVQVLEEDAIGEPLVFLVSDETEINEPSIGAVALWSEKTNEYVAYDFERGDPADFQIVKRALQKKWKGIRDVKSTAQYRDEMEAKRPPNNHNTPH